MNVHVPGVGVEYSRRSRWARLSRCHTVALAVVACGASALGQDDPCAKFTGPLEPCPYRYIRFASVRAALFYPEGQSPWLRYPNIFPLIQVCDAPVRGEGNPKCLFHSLFLDVEVYPNGDAQLICELDSGVSPFRQWPEGTKFHPPIGPGGAFPTGDCPFELHIELPDASVQCPGYLEWGGFLRTLSTPIGGGLRMGHDRADAGAADGGRDQIRPPPGGEDARVAVGATGCELNGRENA